MTIPEIYTARCDCLGALDPRSEYSPTWSIQNINSLLISSKLRIVLGEKNLLNWTPNTGNPFIIARANDPDKMFNMIPGNAQMTPDNPYALTFDPGYVFGPNQGVRSFLVAIYFKIIFTTNNQ
jgi:outer membrane receptor for ferrienterochelin and colicins